MNHARRPPGMVGAAQDSTKCKRTDLERLQETAMRAMAQ
jgi:hypothetical protein